MTTVQGLDGSVEHVWCVGIESEDDPSVHLDAALVETRDVVLQALDLIEPLVRFRKGGSGHGLHPHKDSEATRLRGQGEQLLVFCEKDMGLHFDLVRFAPGAGYIGNVVTVLREWPRR